MYCNVITEELEFEQVTEGKLIGSGVLHLKAIIGIDCMGDLSDWK